MSRPCPNVTHRRPCPCSRGPRDTLDRPLHDLRISVMDRCNFRCPYCMPRETFHEHYRFLKSTERLSFEEITRLTRLFVQLGVKKVRLTGGEPLLRSNISELVGELTALEGVQDVALTTNGVLLAQHAAELKANGLHRITVSLDTLDPEIFKQMSGGFAERDRVLEGIRAAQRRRARRRSRSTAVVERGLNDHTVLDLVEHFRGTGVIVRFIEYMDVGNRNHWSLRSRRAFARAARAHRRALAAACGRGELSRRSRGALRVRRRRRRDRLHLLGHESVLRHLHARAAFLRRRVLHVPVRALGPRPARAAARRRQRRRAALADRATPGLRRGDRYSELRSSLHAGEQPLRKIEMYYIGG